MEGKICLVTGATGGIGKETARALVAQGGTVILVARDKQRGEALRQELLAEHGGADGRLHLYLADMSSYTAVQQLVGDIKAKFDCLHVLVNNAGAIFMQRQLSVDGLEMTFALNHLGYFWLTTGLLELLQASAPARIINVSSDAHRTAQLVGEDWQMTQGYRGFGAYSLSKLANVLFTYELARQLTDKGVTVNALHPGFVGSNFGKNNGLVMRWAMTLLRPFALSNAQGAKTSIYLATATEVNGVTGKYFARQKAVASSPTSYDTTIARRLWDLSTNLATPH